MKKRAERILGRVLASELTGEELLAALGARQEPEEDYTSVVDPITGEEIA